MQHKEHVHIHGRQRVECVHLRNGVEVHIRDVHSDVRDDIREQERKIWLHHTHDVRRIQGGDRIFLHGEHHTCLLLHISDVHKHHRVRRRDVRIYHSALRELRAIRDREDFCESITPYRRRSVFRNHNHDSSSRDHVHIHNCDHCDGHGVLHELHNRHIFCVRGDHTRSLRSDLCIRTFLHDVHRDVPHDVHELLAHAHRHDRKDDDNHDELDSDESRSDVVRKESDHDHCQ